MQYASDLLITDLGPNRLAVISFVRKLLNLELAEAKQRASTLPIKVANGSFMNLAHLSRQLEQLGATVSLGPDTSDYRPDPLGNSLGKPRFMPYWLFVYGTLKRRSRHPMARRLAQAASWIGSAKIAGRLYNLGRFPGLKKPQMDTDWVHGDVYDLGESADQTLEEMDAYENAESPPPTPYLRRPATVFLDDGQIRIVWVYWYQGDASEEDFIASGSYEENCDPA